MRRERVRGIKSVHQGKKNKSFTFREWERKQRLDYFPSKSDRGISIMEKRKIHSLSKRRFRGEGDMKLRSREGKTICSPSKIKK